MEGRRIEPVLAAVHQALRREVEHDRGSDMLVVLDVDLNPLRVLGRVKPPWAYLAAHVMHPPLGDQLPDSCVGQLAAGSCDSSAKRACHATP